MKAIIILVLLYPGFFTCKGAIKEQKVKIARYEFHEFQIKAKVNVSNPFLDAALTGEFAAPSGKIILINGFFDGDDMWKLRFAPNETGIWSYKLKGEHFKYFQQGKILCTKSRSEGFIRLHPKNPYDFAYESGRAFFPMGDTSYGLYDDSPVTSELRTAYLDTRRSQSFNFVRMEVGHSHSRAIADPNYWAWGGTAEHPDLDRFNPVFFKGFDELLLQMKGKGMNAELILLNFYRLPYTNTKQWTQKREQQWLKYLLARYSAFSNIFMWTISNEYETHPDGAYWLDSSDVSWAKQTARFIKDNDPYHHLTTVHSVIPSSTTGNSPASPLDYPWRIGGFFGKEKAMDVLSQQTGQSGTGTKWDEQCQCWNGDDANLVNSIKADRVYQKPVINTENGYEFLTGQPTMKKQVHHTDKVRHSSWRIVCAGGYFAAGFNGTLAHSDIWNTIDWPNRYTFSLKDEGAAAQLGFLYKFFTSLPFWKMEPFYGIAGDAVALADQEHFVIYMPNGGSVALTLPRTGKSRLRWFNPRTGRFFKSETLFNQTQTNLLAPDRRDWVALISKEFAKLP